MGRGGQKLSNIAWGHLWTTPYTDNTFFGVFIFNVQTFQPFQDLKLRHFEFFLCSDIFRIFFDLLFSYDTFVLRVVRYKTETNFRRRIWFFFNYVTTLKERNADEHDTSQCDRPRYKDIIRRKKRWRLSRTYIGKHTKLIKKCWARQLKKIHI